jgi:hypothetical protein
MPRSPTRDGTSGYRRIQPFVQRLRMAVPGYRPLSEDGYIVSDLRVSGLELMTPRRRPLLETALYGVRLQANRLVIEASPHNLGQRAYSLVQVMLAVKDMFVLPQPRMQSFVWEDVREFLDQHNVRNSPPVMVRADSIKRLAT